MLDSKILPQIPVVRLGKPEEVAGLIIYLASDEVAFVTGAHFANNGSQRMHERAWPSLSAPYERRNK